MKRHIQKTGVRKFFGQDFVDLQAEPLKALDAFFAAYGACLIEGCAITEADGGTFNVAPGLVALESTDPDSGVVAVRTMPFAGAKGVALPLYLVAEWTVVERAYGDGKVKPIGYNLQAVASGVAPEGAHLVLTETGGNRFVDAVQDGTHRFITDAERNKWNDVLRQAKEYAQAQASSSQAAAVGLAKAHTDGQVAAVRNELALGDQTALNTAKAYADRIVAALVDGSPELLNTLEELAAALGGDPNFATTVMTEIGKRVKTSEFTAVMATVLRDRFMDCDLNSLPGNIGHGVSRNSAGSEFGPFISFGHSGYIVQLNVGHSWYEGGNKKLKYRVRNGDDGAWSDWFYLYHSGNLAEATAELAGLMSGIDKAKLDAMVGFSQAEKEALGTALVDRGMEGDLNDLPSSVGYGVSRGTAGGEYGPFISFGHSRYTAQISVGHSWYENGNKNLKYRVRNGDTGVWGEWFNIHHSGNLKIIRGSVSAEFGSPSGGSGFQATRSGGIVTITHGLGHSQYNLGHTLHNNGVEYAQLVIIEKQNNAIRVGVKGFRSEFQDLGFDFCIIPY